MQEDASGVRRCELREFQPANRLYFHKIDSKRQPQGGGGLLQFEFQMKKSERTMACSPNYSEAARVSALVELTSRISKHPTGFLS